MRRAWIWVLILLAMALGGVGVVRWWRGPANVPKETRSMRVRTGRAELRLLEANIRLPDPKDGENAWPNRRAMLLEQFRKRDPDVIAMQEVTPAQAAYLIKELPEYGHYPDGRGEEDGVLSPLTGAVAGLNMIMYKAERFAVLESSAGPVRAIDAHTDPRTTAFYSMVVLKEKQGALPETVVFDTHLRHNPRIATQDAIELNNRITAAVRGRPGARVVLMGDMNWDRNSTVYGPLTGVAEAFSPGTPVTVLKDTYDYSAKGTTEKWGSWHNFTGQAMAVWPSDLVLVSPVWEVDTPAEIVRESVGGRWPSDHFLVWVVVR